jgi:hypothetical protein
MADVPTNNSSNDDDLKQLISDLERDLLFQIIFNLRHKSISVNEAQRLAQDFLAILPENDKEHLLIKLAALSKEYPEVREVYLKYAPSYYEEKTHQLIDEMVKYIHEGNIEKAIEIGKQAE